MKKFGISLVMGLLLTSLALPVFATESNTESEEKTESEIEQLKEEVKNKKDALKELRAKRKAEALAKRLAKPQKFSGRVDSADAAAGVLHIRNRSFTVDAKTVIVVLDENGAHVGTLADFQKGDHVSGYLKRDVQDKKKLTALVIVREFRKEKKEKEDEDDDEAATTPPATDSGSTTPSN